MASIKIIDPIPLGICQEIEQNFKSAETQIEKLHLDYQNAVRKIDEDTKLSTSENMERLRLSLSMPQLRHARLNMDYFKEHKIAFLLYGTDEDEKDTFGRVY